MIPETLVYADGKLFVALLENERSDIWWNDELTGAFAIIDADTFSISAIHEIQTDPYDIAVTNDGLIYISSIDHNYSYLYIYRQDGSLLERRYYIYEGSKIAYNRIQNKIYSVSTYWSPRDMQAYLLSRRRYAV